MGKPHKKKDQEGDGALGGGASESYERSDDSISRNSTQEGPTLTDIMQAITATREALEAKMDTLATDMGILRDDHRRLTERVTTIERETAEIPPSLQTMKESLNRMETKITTLENRAEDAENRSRRNNIRLIGVPERTEQGRMEDYLENWIGTVVAPERLSPFFALERAHRVPTRPPKPGTPPRPIVAKQLHRH